MKDDIILYYANFFEKTTEKHNNICEFEISEFALDFINRCILFAKRKNAELCISIKNKQLRIKIEVLHGVFPKVSCDTLAYLMLDANDVQLFPIGDKNKYNLNIIFHLDIKKELS